MCDKFLKSNIFVSASEIENSSNSVGEAMILGVPIITSDAGGIRSLLNHEKECFMYQSSVPYMLVYYIKKMLNKKEKMLEFSKNSKIKVKRIFGKEKNIENLIKIYKDISRSH